MKTPFQMRLPVQVGVMTILLGLAMPSYAFDDDWGDGGTLEIERIFVVTAQEKPETHPFYGVGHKRGMEIDGVAA